jgi:hypothetical protein
MDPYSTSFLPDIYKLKQENLNAILELKALESEKTDIDYLPQRKKTLEANKAFVQKTLTEVTGTSDPSQWPTERFKIPNTPPVVPEPPKKPNIEPILSREEYYAKLD